VAQAPKSALVKTKGEGQGGLKHSVLMVTLDSHAGALYLPVSDCF